MCDGQELAFFIPDLPQNRTLGVLLELGCQKQTTSICPSRSPPRNVVILLPPSVRHSRLFHGPVAVGDRGGRAFMEASMSTVPTRRSSVTPSGICTKGALRTRVGGVPALPPSRCSSPSCSGQVSAV